MYNKWEAAESRNQILHNRLFLSPMQFGYLSLAIISLNFLHPIICTFRLFRYIITWINEQTKATIQHCFFVPQEKSSDTCPAEEAWEALPEEVQAGELGYWGLLTQQRGVELLFFFDLTFLSSNIDEQSAQSHVLDKMTEEEDDAYDFSTDYV